MIRLLTIDDHGELHLESFQDSSAPKYAVLSHTWDREEPTLQDIISRTGSNKAGMEKVRFCLDRAKEHNLRYCWVDTCCIDKLSSAELSRAINSMFRWYHNAERCYVYLADVSVAAVPDASYPPQSTWEPALRQSRWFTRGWTLQELLAPSSVEFFSYTGTRLGDKRSLERIIFEVTKIPVDALRGVSLSSFSYSERKAWAETRKTTEPEDMTYCLLGLLEISMPANYGEGFEGSAVRLDREIQFIADRSSGLVLGKRSTSERGNGAFEEDNDPLQSKRSRIEAVPSLEDDQIKDLVDSLRFDQLEARHLSIKKAHAKTCRWLLEAPEYVRWWDTGAHESHGGFLWIKGKPGSGKSTLMKFALADARKKNTILLSFFFNARGTEIEKSTTGAYRTLLVQLIEQLPHLKSIFNILGPAVLRTGQSPQWDVETLKEILEEAFQNLAGHSVTCFIDALDECDDDEIREMVSFLENIAERSTEGRVHICLASRYYPHITPRWGLELKLERTEGHKQDIEAYVASELKLGREMLAQKIRLELLEKASGVFIWVVLVVAILNKEYDRGQIDKIQKRLREIPADLHTLFQEILTRDTSNKEDMLICIQWILFAKTPLSLEQLHIAIRVGLEQAAPVNISPEQTAPDALHRFLLNSSKGLAEETRGFKPTVQFIHESIRDFLLKEGGLAILWPDLASNVPGHSHTRLGLCCEIYSQIDLTHFVDPTSELPKVSSQEARALRASVSRKFPFLDYAVSNLLYHVDASLKAGMESPTFLDTFQTYEDRWRRACKVLAPYDTNRKDLDHHIIYTLAQRGHANLLHQTLSSINPEYVKAMFYYESLEAAVERAQMSTMSLLLEKSETIQQEPDGEFVKRTFLKSITKQRERISMQLINASLFDIFQDLGLLFSGLLKAAQSELVNLMPVMIDKFADLGERGLVFECARSAPNKTLSMLLIRKWASSMSVAELGHELIYVVHGRPEILELLLPVEHRNDVNWHALSDSCDEMQRCRFMGNRAYSVCQQLIEHGVDRSLDHKSGCCPLQAAFTSGANELVQLLLDHGYLISNIPVHAYWTLEQAMNTEFEESIIPILLKQVKSEVDGEKSLMSICLIACEHSNKNLVRVLIQNGARIDLSHPIEAYESLNEAFTDVSDQSILLALLEQADGSTRGKNLIEVLLIACEDSNSRVAQFLLDSGATIAMMDSFQACQVLGRVSEANCDGNIVHTLLQQIAQTPFPQEYLNSIPAKAGGYYEDLVQLFYDHGAKRTYIDASGGYTLPDDARVNPGNKTIRIMLQKSVDFGIDPTTWTSALVQTRFSTGLFDDYEVHQLMTGDSAEKLVTLPRTPAGRSCQDRFFEGLIKKYRETGYMPGLTGGSDDGIDTHALGPLFIHSCRRGNRDLVKLLLDLGVDASLHEAGEPTALQRAAAHDKDGHILRMLLEYQADLYATPTRYFGSPLFEAAYRGPIQNLRLLLEHGVKLQGGMKYYQDCSEVVKVLLGGLEVIDSRDPRSYFAAVERQEMFISCKFGTLQDYQMQLMLLERQNRKRRELIQQQQDAGDPTE